MKPGYLTLQEELRRRVNENRVVRIFRAKRKVKVKAIPLQALTGPEGTRRLRLPDFKTIGT
jgi:hypothetical protein